MMRRAATLCLIAAVCWIGAARGTVPTNPVHPASTPDPTCWRAPDGTWRLSSTSLRILRSADFFTWEDTGRRLFTREDERQICSRWRHIWAPDVVKIGNVYHLYITHINTADDSAIFVYTAKSAEGPFTNGRQITSGRDTGIIDTIDPEVVRDPATSRLWLFFGSTGRIHRVPLAPDGLSLAPGAKPEPVAGRHVRENPSRLKVFEGSYLHRRNGWWYLFASRGRYADWSYAIVVGRAKKLTADFLDRDGRSMKEGYGTVILASEQGEAFFGPGHNAEIVTIGNHDFLPFHCHVEGPRAGARPLFIQEIFWDRDGWPYFSPSKPQRTIKEKRKK